MANLKLCDVPRNDIESALSYFLQARADGTWDKEKAHSLLMKQDDPDDLIDAMNAITGGKG